MNGKELKVAEYNLTFGTSARMVNVFGLFKYKPNNSLYVIYVDVNTKYNFVYYGSSHKKSNSILSMSCDREKVEEIIKEYIFKVTNKENLDDFEIISLDDVNEIEIISFNKLEIKKEVLDQLIEFTIPKKKVIKEEKVKVKRKKSSFKSLFLLLLIVVIVALVYFCFFTSNKEEVIAKTIVCTKSYEHDDLDYVVVDEEQSFNFNTADTLESVDIVKLYKFETEDAYLNFINKGLYYRYMPDSDDVYGGWSKDDTEHTFKIMTKDKIDVDYSKPTSYEDVLSYYKNENYDCDENIEK